MIDKLKNKHQGEMAYIVGCGPSLLLLKKDHFGKGPVISISNATKKVESLELDNHIYSFQKDIGVIVPSKATLILNEYEKDSYLYLPDYQPRYTFINDRDFGITPHTISALTAAYFVIYMGCNRITMVCCDVNVNGDMRTCVFKNDGSYEITGPNQSYNFHMVELRGRLNKLGVKIYWILPGFSGEIN